MPSACLSVSGEGTGRVRARASVLGKAGQDALPTPAAAGQVRPHTRARLRSPQRCPFPQLRPGDGGKLSPGGPACKQGPVPSLPGPQEPHVGQTGSLQPAPLGLDGRGPARPLQRGPRRALAARTAEEAGPGPAGWARPVTASAAISRPRSRSPPEELRALLRHGRRQK